MKEEPIIPSQPSSPSDPPKYTGLWGCFLLLESPRTWPPRLQALVPGAALQTLAGLRAKCPQELSSGSLWTEPGGEAGRKEQIDMLIMI